MIPYLATIQLRHGDGRQLRLWVPLFLVWLLLLPLVLVLFPVVLVIGLWMRVNAFNLYWTAWRILASMRDTLVEVKSGEAEFQFRMV